MNLVLYARACTTCSMRSDLNRIKAFCAANNHRLTLKNILHRPSYAEEASQLGLEIPSVYCIETGRSVGAKHIKFDKLEGIIHG